MIHIRKLCGSPRLCSTQTALNTSTSPRTINCRPSSVCFVLMKRKSAKSGKADHYCINSGSVLAAFGIRDCNDIDYIVPDLALADLQGPDISSHFDEYANFPVSVDDFIANPAHHFSWKGTKIMALQTVLFFKQLRGKREGSSRSNPDT